MSEKVFFDVDLGKHDVKEDVRSGSLEERNAAAGLSEIVLLHVLSSATMRGARWQNRVHGRGFCVCRYSFLYRSAYKWRLAHLHLFAHDIPASRVED